MILVGTFGNSLVAIDSANGEIQWTVETSGWVWSSPAVFDGIVYFGDTAGIAYAVAAKNGEEIWQKTIDGAIAASPAIDENAVYFVTETGTVHAANLTSGGAVWPNDAELEGQLLSDPIFFEDQLLLGVITQDCVVQAVDTDSGRAGCLFSPEAQ
jgi:outer membrane protein assembly factor BamB